MTHPFRKAKDTSILFFCCQIIPLQYSIAIQIVQLKFRASFKDNVTEGDIFSWGPGEVPVGKSVSLQLPAYMCMV